MRKNIIAQNCGNGRVPIPSGYVINANAGPPVATDDTGNPVTSTTKTLKSDDTFRHRLKIMTSYVTCIRVPKTQQIPQKY